MACLRVVVHGRVQGVWFRGWTIQEAQARGLTGWVRNRRDGTVEALFAGPEATIADMVDACQRGPPAARVSEVEQFPCDDAPGAGFHHRPTE